jgi:hypothetical protein
MLVLVLQAWAFPLPAQDQDLLGRKVPPLQSLAAFAHEVPGLRSGELTLSRKESNSLAQSRKGSTLALPAIDEFMANDGPPLEFRRVELFAPGARIMVVGADGTVERQQDARQFFIASNSSTGVGLALDSASGEISGFAIKGSSKLRLQGRADGRIQLQSVEELSGDSSVCSTALGDQPPESVAFLNDSIPESLSGIAGGGGISFQTVIAVDTDTEWMAQRDEDPELDASDNALNWITNAFLAMNVFYERDVELHLLIGDVFLRLSSDPYSLPGTASSSDKMNEFATYWRNNMASVDRDFATLFSGRGTGAGSYSGIAWVNQYCIKGATQGDQTRGSYSYNYMGANRTVANTAIFIGHELGHNFGSPHTHCYTNPPIDQCYSGESGCYTGPESCPAGGKGTIMSYCHLSSGASCGTNNSEFHPRVQSLIEGRLAANFPSCISEYEEPIDPGEPPIFKNNFESP